MGLFDRFRDGLGVERPIPDAAAADDQAIARYRYLLRTAPPETIEQAHAEAFAQLTPEQRRQVLQQLVEEAPAAERGAVIRGGDSPGQLAQVATRAEIRQPGVLERLFGAPGAASGMAGPGMGSLFAGSFLTSMAGSVLGSMIAQHFFSSHPAAAGFFDDAPAHAANPPAFWPAEQGATGSGLDPGPAIADDINFAAADPDLGDALDSGFDGGSFDV